MTYLVNTSCQIRDLERIYETHFPGKSDGYFVDVGANDGYTFSNTYTLVQAGWSGLMIEPLPESAKKCRDLYFSTEKVKVLEICIGDTCGLTDLYLGWSPTISLEAVKRNPYGFTYDPNKYITVLVNTLDVVLQDLEVPTNFDVLNIDVEGAEPQVLAGFSTVNIYKPKMIIIETHIGNPDVQRAFNSDEILQWFSDKPYDLLQRDGLNDVYILK